MQRKTSHDDSLSAEIRKCPHCGKAFIPKRKNQRYCSPTCRKMESAARIKGAEGTAPAVKPPSRKRRKSKPQPDLSREDFEEMVEPVGTYEDMLRLSVRKLKQAIENPDTSTKDLPALAKQLIAASHELDNFSDPEQLVDENVEVDDDVSFRAEAI